MNENKKATEFTPEKLQTNVELTDEELEQAAGGLGSDCFVGVCEKCGRLYSRDYNSCPHCR